jgi:uncharacterized Zn finger protein
MARAKSASDGASAASFRFDPEALRELAGDTSFRRGEEYFRLGAVTLLSVEPKRVLAAVAGTEAAGCSLRQALPPLTPPRKSAIYPRMMALTRASAICICGMIITG